MLLPLAAGLSEIVQGVPCLVVWGRSFRGKQQSHLLLGTQRYLLAAAAAAAAHYAKSQVCLGLCGTHFACRQLP